MSKKIINKRIKKPGVVLVEELSQLIEQSQQQVKSVANGTVTILFWKVGERINTHILQNKRAEYGKEIVSTVSTLLSNKYGRNFELRNVRRMMQFAEQFDIQNIEPFSMYLSWSQEEITSAN